MFQPKHLAKKLGHPQKGCSGWSGLVTYLGPTKSRDDASWRGASWLGDAKHGNFLELSGGFSKFLNVSDVMIIWKHDSELLSGEMSFGWLLDLHICQTTRVDQNMIVYSSYQWLGTIYSFASFLYQRGLSKLDREKKRSGTSQRDDSVIHGPKLAWKTHLARCEVLQDSGSFEQLFQLQQLQQQHCSKQQPALSCRKWLLRY